MGDVDDKIEVLPRRFRWSDWLRPVLHILYPPCCAACGIRTGVHHALCPGCWRQMRFIERPFCEVLGIPFSFDPGEGMVCAEAIAEPPIFDRLRAVALHEGPARSLVHALKYRDRTELAGMMAHWMQRAAGVHLQEADAIIPVPLHWSRLASRRFNQAAELARALSRLSGKPLLSDVLIRRKRTLRQVGLTANAREDNLRAAFRIVPGRENMVFGRHIILVDDVYTTGATVSSATRALKRAGATEVTVLSFAMALRQPI
ncbi:ComF family protein [Affinirhizobium pseudoryzae]|uniref:ComF family protein n=1 Tax=Allorhizobium pseudoryzae TaxID=379684 RepID=UPI0013EA9E1B|nr:ComF family protein [Allorhizobium pseudoryzae]